MKELKNKLAKITLANSILSYLAVGFSCLVLILFLLTLKNSPAFILLALAACAFVGGLVGIMIITCIILSAIQISTAKKVKSTSNINYKTLTSVLVICDVVALIGILFTIIFQALTSDNSDSLMFISENITIKDLANKIVPISISLSLLACLTQGIFNSIYFSKIKSYK